MQKTILLQKKKVEVDDVVVQLEASLQALKEGRVKKTRKMSDELRRHLEAGLADAKAGRIRRVR